MGILQIEHLKDGVGSLAVLALHDGVCDAHLLGGHVVFKHSLAMQTEPCVLRAGNGDLDVGVCLQVLVNILLVVGAEPQLAVQLTGKHEGMALGLAVTAYGGQILHRVCVQKFYDFIHGMYLHTLFFSDSFIVMRFVRLVKYAQYCGVVTKKIPLRCCLLFLLLKAIMMP